MERTPVLDIRIEANGPAVHLHRAQFVGEGHDLADGLHILFFEIEKGEQA